LTPSEKAKDARLRRIYKTTLDAVTAQLKEQGGGCAICGRSATKYIMNLDHSHDCCGSKRKDKNKDYCGLCNRGLLCYICNRKVIGAIERWKKLGVDVERAIEYLRHWDRVLLDRGAYAKKESKKAVRKK
jgi:hypothetical protein